MKIVEKDLRKGEVKLIVETPEDVWAVSQVVDAGDVIKGKTMRKVKVSEEADPTKRAVYMEIEVEKVDFAGDQLRLNGKMREGPEDVPRGSYHTFQVEVGTTCTIKKGHWFGFQLQRLEEAEEQQKAKVLVVLFDREDAYFGRLRSGKLEMLAHLQGDVQKKRSDVQGKGNFFEQIGKQIKEYDDRFKSSAIVVASPAFWKEELLKVVKDDALRKKFVQTTCSSVDESAFDEVLRRDDVRQALARERVAKELIVVDQVLGEIAKKGAVTYGQKQVEGAVEAGAVRILVVTDGLIKKLRDENKFAKLDQLMRQVDSEKGEVILIASDHQGGRRLDGLGGVAALLRYKLE